MLIQMQAQPDDYTLSPDSMSVSWNVFATMRIATGVTSISDDLPPATVYTYYEVLGETFVTEETAALVDKMAPVISAAKAFLDIAVFHLDASDSRVVHIDDTVSGKHTHALTRAAGNGLDHIERVVAHVELDADAAELTLQRLLQFLCLLGVGIGRVGVKALKHALDGILDELILVDRVNIQAVDGIFRIQQFLHCLRHRPLSRHRE